LTNTITRIVRLLPFVVSTYTSNERRGDRHERQLF
jgi:hypothetical protein